MKYVEDPGMLVMRCEIKPPVQDSANASRKPRFRNNKPTVTSKGFSFMGAIIPALA